MPLLFATALADLELPLAMKIFLIAWFFFVGGCFGSFMNVVIFRMPRGRNIASPPSACPKCGKFIRGYDNLPVLSWLILRGKCRDCSEPISARYPIVEFLVGLIFMALAVQVLLPGGPWWLTNLSHEQFFAQPLWKLGAAYAYYMLLVCTLICASYIAWDGQRVPKRLFVVALLVGCVLPLYWNEVRPFAISYSEWKVALVWGVTTGVLGIMAGLMMGGMFDTIHRLPERDRLTMALVTIGWVLGPVCVLVIGAAGGIFAVLWHLALRRKLAGAESAPLAGATIATVVTVLSGGLWIEPLLYQLLPLIAVSSVVIIISAVLLRWLMKRTEQEQAKHD